MEKAQRLSIYYMQNLRSVMEKAQRQSRPKTNAYVFLGQSRRIALGDRFNKIKTF